MQEITPYRQFAGYYELIVLVISTKIKVVKGMPVAAATMSELRDEL
jgi:hypothetical protein